MGQHVNGGLLQGDAGQVDGGESALHGFDIALHFGRFAQQHVHGHVDWCPHARHGRVLAAPRGGRACLGRPGAAHARVFIGDDQIALFGRHPHHRKRAAFALAQGLEQRQRLGGDRQHVALLAFVAPDFLGRQAGLFERHGAQVKARTAPGVVGQLGEGVGETARAHVMNRQNRVGPGHQPALVDDLLRPALDLRVAALHRVKVKVGRVVAGGHGTGGTAAHADAHAGAAELDQQGARRKRNLVRLAGIDHTQAAGQHDGLVVAALLGLRLGHAGSVLDRVAQALLVLAKVTQQIGPAKLVVERRAAQRALDHDLQGAGNVRRTPVIDGRLTPIDFGNREPGQAGFGFGAAAGGAFVADLAAGAGRGPRKRRNGGRVVVGFHLHQDVLQGAAFLISANAHAGLGQRSLAAEAFNLAAFHHRGVVRIRHQHVLGVGLVRVADHAKQAVGLGHAVNGELGVENLVAAVLAVGLGEHHEFDVGGVALQLGEGLHQVVHFVVGQRQAKLGVGGQQRGLAAAQHVDMRHGRGRQAGKQAMRRGALEHHALGHAVMQQGGHLRQLRLGQGRLAQQSGFEADAVFGDALDPVHRQAAIVGNVGGFGSPGRHGAKTRRDHNQRTVLRAGIGFAVVQQGGQLLLQRGAGRLIGANQVHMARGNATDFFMHGLQPRQKLLNTESAKSATALKRGDVQSQLEGLRERLTNGLKSTATARHHAKSSRILTTHQTPR